MRKISPPSVFDPPTVHPIANRCSILRYRSETCVEDSDDSLETFSSTSSCCQCLIRYLCEAYTTDVFLLSYWPNLLFFGDFWKSGSPRAFNLHVVTGEWIFLVGNWVDSRISWLLLSRDLIWQPCEDVQLDISECITVTYEPPRAWSILWSYAVVSSATFHGLALTCKWQGKSIQGKAVWLL